MASTLAARSVHYLIISRTTIQQTNTAAWNAITKRDSETQQVVLSILISIVWLITSGLIFLPPLLWVFYTLNKLYPSLAILEAADCPPEYELVTKENDAKAKENIAMKSNTTSTTTNSENLSDQSSSSSEIIADETGGVGPIRSQPITSGIFATLLLLRANGGSLKAFKWQLLAICVSTPIVFGLSFIPHFPDVIIDILVSFATTKVETVWIYAAVSKDRNTSPWKISPSYLSIFKVTVLPLIIQSFLLEIVYFVAQLPFGHVFGTHSINPVYTHTYSVTRVSAVLALAFMLYACIMLPTEVILTRTRAAMLPEDISTLVVLDPSIRSQQVENMGFMSWTHAWKTFSRESWLRLVKLRVKIVAATILVQILVTGLFFTQSLIFLAALSG